MMAPATITHDEAGLDELEPTQMSDREHLATFGWAWDDPDTTEVEA